MSLARNRPGGTHLMDVRMVKPFYYRGELWAYLSNTGHWSDTGGMVPGGFCATATEIQQEGLRLPPVHLVRRGELIQDVVDVIMSNIRVPEKRLGELVERDVSRGYLTREQAEVYRRGNGG